MSNIFIYGLRFTMLGLADGITPSQPDFPNKQALVLVLCQLKNSIRLIIAFFIVMGAQCWVPVPLCRPAATPFLEAVGLFLEILILVG